MRHLRRRDYAVVSLNLLGTAAATALSILQFSQATPIIWTLGMIAVLGVTGGTVYAIVTANQATALADRERRRQAETAERERQQQSEVEALARRELAESAIEATCRIFLDTVSASPDETGLIVFLPDAGGVLRTTYTLNKDGRPDASLSFEKWEGATGHAWGTGNLVVADLAAASERELRTTWKLSSSYVQLTRHLKTVVAVPIRTQDASARLLGVVSIDSTLPPDVCGFASDSGQEAILQLAALLARLMTLAGVV